MTTTEASAAMRLGVWLASGATAAGLVGVIAVGIHADGIGARPLQLHGTVVSDVPAQPGPVPSVRAPSPRHETTTPSVPGGRPLLDID